MAPSASPPPSSPSPQPVSPAAAPSTDPQAYTHQCFICLLNDLETPTEPFVNPCPCTLEAHESCLLRWVAESEANKTASATSPRKPLRCPACHHRIRVTEPADAVVAVRDALSRGLARASPLVLLGLVFGGGAVGSAWYGLLSAQLFAGPAATARWLGLRALVDRPYYQGGGGAVPVWRWAPLWVFTAKMWTLSLVGPALTIGRAIPAAGNLLLVPTSLLSAALLVAWDDMPTWPPSPAWAVTLFPFVNLTYSNVYYEFFGAFERRLNRALRARPLEDDREAVPRQQDAAAGGQQQGQGAGQQQGDQQHREQSVWAAIWGLGQAVVGIFRDQDVVLEAEVGPHRNIQADVELQIEFGEEEFDEREAEEMVQEIAEELNELAAAEQAPFVAPEDAAVAAPAANAEPAPQQQQQQQGDAPGQQAPNDNNNNNNNNIDNDDDAPQGGDNNRALGGTLTDIMSSIVLSLLYPGICFGMGEVLRVGLPRSWVTRPAPTWGGGRPAATGLLQRRWGRSLVGGCLYVVLKDAFTLYAKYRQVQQKSKRRVRNVERRRGTST